MSALGCFLHLAFWIRLDAPLGSFRLFGRSAFCRVFTSAKAPEKDRNSRKQAGGFSTLDKIISCVDRCRARHAGLASPQIRTVRSCSSDARTDRDRLRVTGTMDHPAMSCMCPRRFPQEPDRSSNRACVMLPMNPIWRPLRVSN